MKPFRKTLMAVGVAAACCSGIADASHFRGAAMVPSVDSSGLLTVTSISFWRNQTTHTGSDPFDAFPIAGIDDGGDPSVSGVGTMTAVGSDSGATGFAARTIENNSVAAFTFGSPATASATGWHRADAGLDSRYSKVTQTHTIQLTGAGTYDISAGSCCRVAGMANTGSTAWNMESSIFWDGATANTPIVFDFSNIQQEVVRGQDYNGNVGAVAGGGVTLSYDNALNTNIVSQPPGYVLDPVTGDMFIPSANTAT